MGGRRGGLVEDERRGEEGREGGRGVVRRGELGDGGKMERTAK